MHIASLVISLTNVSTPVQKPFTAENAENADLIGFSLRARRPLR